MLPQVHLTLHSSMPGSRWGIIPSWLSGLLRSFLYSSFVYSCHLFLTSSASVRSMPFLPFIVPTFAWNVPLVSLIFLKRSLVSYSRWGEYAISWLCVTSDSVHFVDRLGWSHLLLSCCKAGSWVGSMPTKITHKGKNNFERKLGWEKKENEMCLIQKKKKRLTSVYYYDETLQKRRLCDLKKSI